MKHEFYCEKSWADIIRKQEEILHFEAFSREDALKLGLEIIRIGKESYHKPLAVRILEDNITVFSHYMEGTSDENSWWMKRKLAVSQLTGHCSILTCAEAFNGELFPFWEGREANYAPCGGCFPIYIGNETKPTHYALVSNMHHYEDHQVIADAMASLLGKEIPRLVPIK